MRFYMFFLLLFPLVAAADDDFGESLIKSSAFGAFRPVDVGSAEGALSLEKILKAVRRDTRSSMGSSVSMSEAPDEMWAIVRQVVDRHPAIRETLASLSSQIGALDAAKAGYFPKVSAGINGGQLSYYGTGRVLSVSASQMVYDFGKVGGAVGQAEAAVYKQQASVLLQIDDVATRAAHAAIDLHRHQRMLAAAELQLHGIDDVAEFVRLRTRGGVSSESDLLQAKSRQQAATAIVQQLVALRDQAQEHLSALLGAKYLSSQIQIPDARLRKAWSSASLDFDRSPKIVMAEADLSAAKSHLLVAKADQYPTLTLDAATNKALSGINPNDPSSNGWYSTVTFNFTTTVFQGGGLAARERSARDAIRAAESHVAGVRLEVSDSARGLGTQIASMDQRLDAQKARVKSIADASDLYREQYRLGTRSVLELLNSVNEVYQARTDALIAEHDLWSTLVDYFNAIGATREVFSLEGSRVQNIGIES